MKQFFRGYRIECRREPCHARNLTNHRTVGPKTSDKGIELCIAVSLRETPAVFCNKKRYMCVGRMSKTQQILKIHLLWSRRKQIDAAHDRSNALIEASSTTTASWDRICAVGAAHDEVPAFPGEVLANAPLDAVVEFDEFVGDDEPFGGRSNKTFFETLRRIEVSARAGIDETLPSMRSRGRVQIGSRAKARVYQPLLFEHPERAFVGLFPIVLEKRPLVPKQPQGFKVPHYRVDIALLRTLRVEVFDAQDDFAALRFRNQPSNEGGENIPRMHASRRRRSEPPFHGRFALLVLRVCGLIMLMFATQIPVSCHGGATMQSLYFTRRSSTCFVLPTLRSMPPGSTSFTLEPTSKTPLSFSSIWRRNASISSKESDERLGTQLYMHGHADQGPSRCRRRCGNGA